MSTATIISIALLALAVIVILAVLGWVLINKHTQQRRHAKAEELRDRANDELLHVNRRQALADETAAKARAAQAEADIKAAQASNLEQQAAAHLNEATNSRDRLNEQWDRANALDPATPTTENAQSAESR